MSCKSILKFCIYASLGLILAFAIGLEIVFVMLGTGKYAEASGTKAWLIGWGTGFSAVLLIITIIGCCGVCSRKICYLIIYSVICGLLFIGFGFAFADFKKGKGSFFILN